MSQKTTQTVAKVQPLSTPTTSSKKLPQLPTQRRLSEVRPVSTPLRRAPVTSSTLSLKPAPPTRELPRAATPRRSSMPHLAKVGPKEPTEKSVPLISSKYDSTDNTSNFGLAVEVVKDLLQSVAPTRKSDYDFSSLIHRVKAEDVHLSQNRPIGSDSQNSVQLEMSEVQRKTPEPIKPKISEKKIQQLENQAIHVNSDVTGLLQKLNASYDALAAVSPKKKVTF